MRAMGFIPPVWWNSNRIVTTHAHIHSYENITTGNFRYTVFSVCGAFLIYESASRAHHWRGGWLLKTYYLPTSDEIFFLTNKLPCFIPYLFFFKINSLSQTAFPTNYESFYCCLLLSFIGFRNFNNIRTRRVIFKSAWGLDVLIWIPY